MTRSSTPAQSVASVIVAVAVVGGMATVLEDRGEDVIKVLEGGVGDAAKVLESGEVDR